ncbi:MAG TPA: hypothetical protein VFJ72_16990 [Rubrobacteraceae bacterium]|nr:hypothetical protein [Rubrobacteraceae bacterium]
MDERRIFLTLDGYYEHDEEKRSVQHQDERALRWRENLARARRRERARERGWARLAAAWVAAVRWEDLARKREQDEKRKRAEAEAAWEEFTRTERHELKLRQDGQLARLLGERLPRELPATLQRLADEDRRQALAGMVALMSNGSTKYKNISDLCPADMPARIAANRLRTAWLKERRDQWLGRWEPPL